MVKSQLELKPSLIPSIGFILIILFCHLSTSFCSGSSEQLTQCQAPGEKKIEQILVQINWIEFYISSSLINL